MKYSLSSQCKKQIDKIKQKDGFLYKKIKKQLKIFAQDPQHSSLRLHKLSGSQSDTWSISINRSIRMLFVYQDIKSGKNEKSIVFYVIGSHDQVYK